MMIRLATLAMGTRFEAVLHGDDGAFLRAAGEAALMEIEDWDRRLSLFRRDSLLSFVNRLAADHAVRVDDECFHLLARCESIHHASRGAFDPTVAPLMRAYGLHPRHGHAGEPLSLERARDLVGFDGVELDHARRTVRFRRPGMALDLGSIAKGHALDAAGGALREAGVTSALVHGGTSGVIAIGTPEEGDGWAIAIRPPPGSRAGLPVPVVRLKDESLSVSAPHGRSALGPAGAATHVLDPRSKAPVRGARLSAVVGPCAADADAWSTALLVLRCMPHSAPREVGWILRDEESMPIDTPPHEGEGPAENRPRMPGWRLGGVAPDRFRAWTISTGGLRADAGPHTAEVPEEECLSLTVAGS
jgi:thiamine biosynthesis lipoprotein